MGNAGTGFMPAPCNVIVMFSPCGAIRVADGHRGRNLQITNQVYKTVPTILYAFGVFLWTAIILHTKGL